MRALVLLLLLGCAALPAAAAPSLSERSLIHQGIWWDSAHNGHGFDVHLNGREVGLLWFSFRPDGSPVWYLAGGEFDQDGKLTTDLIETRWQNGELSRISIGRISLQRVHQQYVVMNWQLPEGSGQWQLRPFRVSAVIPERNASGAFYDASQPGFGLTIDQQGNIQSTVAYLYDDQGRPVWWIGARDADESTLTLQKFNGPCPSCTPRTLAETESLIAELDVAQQELRLRAGDNATALNAEFRQLDLTRFTSTPESRQADYRLAHFDSDGELKQFLDAALLEPDAWAQLEGSIDFSPAPPAAAISISQTNNVVDGVDEGDTSKTDGQFLYSFASDVSGSRLLPRVRIAKLEGQGPELSVVGELPLSFPTDEPFERQLYLTSNRLITLATSPTYTYFIDFSPPPPDIWLEKTTQIEIYDRSGTSPTLRWRAEIDGKLVDSRRIGNQLYLVLRYTPELAGFVPGARSANLVAANRALLEQAPLSDLLPGLKVNGGERQALLEASEVLLPPQGDRYAQPDLALVLRVDLDQPQIPEALAVLGGVDAIHVSQNALYLATSRFNYVHSSFVERPEGIQFVDLHRVELVPNALDASASGSIDGRLESNLLLQPFRLSEHNGMLRVLTFGNFEAFGSNKLSVLAPSTRMPGLLKLVSDLPNSKRPAPIGKPNERLYASRFVGNRLFAVTFRTVDPLYVIDLADPAQPAIRGELELPGFSQYLHPLNENLLFGVGQNTAEYQGVSYFDGMKVSLFDVSDPANPRVLAEQRLGERGTGSSLLQSHHAFSVLPDGDDRWRVAFPIRIHGNPLPSRPSAATQPVQKSWTHSGIYAFGIDASDAQARLETPTPLVVLRGDQASSEVDDAADGARAFLLSTGAVYVNNGRFWSFRWAAPELANGPH